MHQVGERGPVPNDFETVRKGLNWKGSGSETPARRAALDRIEAEVERLREIVKSKVEGKKFLRAEVERLRAALEDIEKWGEWESAPIARAALAGEKVP
jgi:hypothetical protein